MPKSKQPRIHVELAQPVEVSIRGHRVSFLGANLLNRVVMIEYDIDPPLERPMPFGPHLLTLDVTDNADGQLYPTTWEDFPWPLIAPGRTTTRLDRRPPAAATMLHIVVREAPADRFAPRDGRRVTAFELPLPRQHTEPRVEHRHSDPPG